MKPVKGSRIVKRSNLKMSARGTTAQAQTETEGLNAARPAKRARQSLMARMASYLRSEYAALKRGQDLTLEQVLANLGKATEGDRLLRKHSAELMFLMASDISTARKYPIQGVPTDVARPMRAWRERYNGLERFLPKPS